MPAVTSAQLVDAILDAIHQSGEAGALLSGIQAHPRRFAVTGPDRSFELWVYAWTLTHGGGQRSQEEYRIQMTSVTSPLPLNPDGPTVLIGYDPNLSVFAAFDVTRHQTFTTGSPSVQIDRRVLNQALQDGLAFHRKSNDEIAVAVRSDQFMPYVRHAHQLHGLGAQARTFQMLSRASALQPLNEADLLELAPARRRVVEIVMRLARAANFRHQVIDAYGHRCAVTRVQLRLVEAAHILPVAAPGSVDHVSNGLALSPTYHRAFDNGLIYLNEDYRMCLNPRRLDDLRQLDLHGGVEAFRSSLGNGRIHLPADRGQRPQLAFIARANRLRRIPT